MRVVGACDGTVVVAAAECEWEMLRRWCEASLDADRPVHSLLGADGPIALHGVERVVTALRDVAQHGAGRRAAAPDALSDLLGAAEAVSDARPKRRTKQPSAAVWKRLDPLLDALGDTLAPWREQTPAGLTDRGL